MAQRRRNAHQPLVGRAARMLAHLEEYVAEPVRNAPELRVDIDVHGVSNCRRLEPEQDGGVLIQLRCLGKTVETLPATAVQPLLLHEGFTFRRLYPHARGLMALYDQLPREQVRAALLRVSAERNDRATELAFVEMSLLDLLFPAPARERKPDVDLVMPLQYGGIGDLRLEITTSLEMAVDPGPVPRPVAERALMGGPRVRDWLRRLQDADNGGWASDNLSRRPLPVNSVEAVDDLLAPIMMQIAVLGDLGGKLRQRRHCSMCMGTLANGPDI